MPNVNKSIADYLFPPLNVSEVFLIFCLLFSATFYSTDDYTKIKFVCIPAILVCLYVFLGKKVDKFILQILQISASLIISVISLLFVAKVVHGFI